MSLWLDRATSGSTCTVGQSNTCKMPFYLSIALHKIHKHYITAVAFRQTKHLRPTSLTLTFNVTRPMQNTTYNIHKTYSVHSSSWRVCWPYCTTEWFSFHVEFAANRSLCPVDLARCLTPSPPEHRAQPQKLPTAFAKERTFDPVTVLAIRSFRRLDICSLE